MPEKDKIDFTIYDKKCCNIDATLVGKRRDTDSGEDARYLHLPTRCAEFLCLLDMHAVELASAVVPASFLVASQNNFVTMMKNHWPAGSQMAAFLSILILDHDVLCFLVGRIQTHLIIEL